MRNEEFTAPPRGTNGTGRRVHGDTAPPDPATGGEQPEAGGHGGGIPGEGTAPRREERLRRSRIYVPGNRPRMIRKAASFTADAIILDLEDSVPPEEKAAARIMVSEALTRRDFEPGTELMVRINPLSTCGREDLAVILQAGPDAIVLPKCDGPEDVRELEMEMERIIEGSGTVLPGAAAIIAILPLIETARGVLNAYAIAACSPRVEALTFGGEDFTRDIGAERTPEGDELFLARSMLVMAAKAAGKQALDTIYPDVKDEEGLRRDTMRMKRLGFDGKGAIHPAQIPVIHAVYTPTEDEIAGALEVVRAALEAARSGGGVAVLRGKMIDPPVIRRAEKVIRTARRLGLDVPELDVPELDVPDMDTQ